MQKFSILHGIKKNQFLIMAQNELKQHCFLH